MSGRHEPELSPASAERDIGAVREGIAPVGDRLSTTLFLAAAIHVLVLLGVTFRPGPPAAVGTPSLDVMLLANPASSQDPNPDAAFLAQAAQSGSGTAPDARAVESGRPGLTGQAGRAGARDAASEASRDSATRALVRVRSARGEGGATTTAPAGGALPALAASGPVWDSHLGPAPHLTGKRSDFPVRPDTRESAVALYLDRWRQHVEAVGNEHYPLATVRRGHLTGNPVLEVQLLADGTLGEVRLQHSSGVPALDRAAFGILRLAVPFEAFPPELRQSHPALRLSYEWQFNGSRLHDSGRR